jgi:hypothetical protein
VSNLKEPGGEDAFDKDSKDIVHTIMLFRIYDMLSIIAHAVDYDKAAEMIKDHSEGKIWGPSPSWNMSDESDDD